MSADNLSARIRAAQPMARVEMTLLPGGPSFLPPPIQRETQARQNSTFGHSAGQLDAPSRRQDLRPKRSRGAAAVVALVVFASMVIVGAKFRRTAGTFIVTALSPSTPATIRLNFSSDPDGALVTSAGGIVLGVTPLSTDVPFGNVGLEYILRKQGYLPKRLAAVPNLAAPLFAVLE